VLSVKRILRDYEDAGSVNSLISLWGFVDDAAFLTKAGHVGVVYQLRGIDYEGLTHAQRTAIVHRLEAALRVFDEHWRVYEYVVKRNIPPVSASSCSQPVANEAIQERVSYLNGRRSELFQMRLFVVLLYEPPTRARTSTSIRDLWTSPIDGIRHWLSPAETLRLLDEHLYRAVATLHHKADAFQVQLNDIGLTKLPKARAFRFLRELVNYDEAVIDAASVKYLSHSVSLDVASIVPPPHCGTKHLTSLRLR